MTSQDIQAIYYPKEIAKVINKTQYHVLDFARSGLTFSMYLIHANAELRHYEKQIEDIIDGQEIFTLELKKQSFKVFYNQILDLLPTTPLTIAHRNDVIIPKFHIDGWHEVIVDEHMLYASINNIFVTSNNLAAYRKINRDFDIAFKEAEYEEANVGGQKND